MAVEIKIKSILDNLYEKYKNSDFLLSKPQIQELCDKKTSFWQSDSYWNILKGNLKKGISEYEILFGTVNGVVFWNQTIPSGETYYSIMFYNDNPVSPLNVLRLQNFNDTFSMELQILPKNQKQIAFISKNDFDRFYVKTGNDGYQETQGIAMPVQNHNCYMFFNELIDKLKKYAERKNIVVGEQIKQFVFEDIKNDKYTIVISSTTLNITKEYSLGSSNEIKNKTYELSKIKNIRVEKNFSKIANRWYSSFDLDAEDYSGDLFFLGYFFYDENIEEANQMVGLVRVLQEYTDKSKTEILKILDGKKDEKKLLVNEFINEFDENRNNLLDILESNTFGDILKNNQKLILEKNPDYIHKFVKLSHYIKTKSTNLQELFTKTLVYLEENDAVLIDESIKEADFFKGMVHSYNLILFHSVNMISALLSDELITFYEIYETYDKLGVFNSNWENEVSGKLANIEFKLQDMIESLQQMESQLCVQLEILTTSIESSFDSLEESVNTQLSATNSLIGFNNLLTGIQTYQLFKLNNNTKSLGR
jgi:hypothetical protein